MTDCRVSSELRISTFKNTCWALALLLLTLGADIWIVLANEDRLPQTVAIHWNIHGIIDNYASRNGLIIMSAGFPIFFTIIVFIIQGFILLSNKPAISHPYWTSDIHYPQLLPIMVVVNYLLGIIMNVLWNVLLFPLWKYNIVCSINPENPQPCDYEINYILNTSIFIVGILIPIMMYTWFVYSVPKIDSTYQNNNEEDQYWHYGFYYNSTDSRICLPKRYGTGWTLNMAKPTAQIISGILLFVILLSCTLPFVFM
ncbi:hypothetical protein WA158_007483 [Blastocystis sp. Blastoise]